MMLLISRDCVLLLMILLQSLKPGVYAERNMKTIRKDMHIKEDAKIGTIVGNAFDDPKETVDDQEPGDPEQYFIEPIPYYKKFTALKSGDIKVIAKLDFEEQQTYTFFVYPATQTKKITQVKVILLDVNDNPPRWIKANDLSIPVDLSVEDKRYKRLYPVGWAVDADTGPGNGVQDYTLVSNSGRDVFRAYRKWESRTNATCYIDVISKPSILGLGRFKVRVRALDGGKPPLYSDTTITITITRPSANSAKQRAETSAALSQLLNSVQLVQLVITSFLLRYFVI